MKRFSYFICVTFFIISSILRFEDGEPSFYRLSVIGRAYATSLFDVIDDNVEKEVAQGKWGDAKKAKATHQGPKNLDRKGALLGQKGSVEEVPAGSNAEVQATFMVFKSMETNIRTGPGKEYPIKFVSRCKGYPMRVTAHFGNWSMLTDVNGIKGWVNENLMAKGTNAIIKSNSKRDLVCEAVGITNANLKPKPLTVQDRCDKNAQIDVEILRRLPNIKSVPIVRMEVGSIVKVLRCKDSWCKVLAANKFRGWLRKDRLWGNISDSTFRQIDNLIPQKLDQ